MKKNFRAFLAVDFSKEIKKTILENIKPFRSILSSKKINWVKENKLHITLCFLGNITEDQHNSIDEKIKETIKNISPFTLKLTNLNPFPSRRKFHVLAIDVEASKPLEKLAQIIKEDVTSCGIEAEKREFKPHVTVAKIERGCNISHQIFKKMDPRSTLKAYWDKLRGDNKVLVDNKNLIELPPISFKATEVKLFESNPDSGGSIYTPVAVYKFKEDSI